MDAHFVNERRDALVSRMNTLSRREAGIQTHLRGQDGRNEVDFADRVSFNQADDVLEALDDTARAELIDIRAALGRMDDGEYGVCEACGDDIPEGRLVALPATRTCVKCAK